MTVRVLVSSAGRRNYLVNWFSDSLTEYGLSGRIYAGDVDITAPARYSADEFVQLPPVSSSEYQSELIRICEDESIDLALSLNDYENSLWSELNLHDYRGKTKFLCLQPSVHKQIEDKFACHDALQRIGLSVPLTLTASSILQGKESASELGDDVVIKNRFGSGSYGLCMSTSSRLERDLDIALTTVRDHRGRDLMSRDEAAEYLVVQKRVTGIEYGLDIVNTFDSRFAGCLARQKLGMRGGETSSAKTVSPEPFAALAETIATYSRHRGLIDTDVIVDRSGALWVIDVNPRFGGGYPFSHYAGANVPGLYLSWLHEVEVDPRSYLRYDLGVISHKTISIVGDR